jgi:hypothetical protein
MGRRPDDGFQYGRKPLIDRIMEEYTKMPGADPGDLNLNDAERLILERWVFIDGLMRKHRPKLKMKDIEAMTRRRYDISNGQFWIDWKNTDRLFGTTFCRSKEYTRAIYIEHLEQIASLAEARGDYKSQINALELAAKLQGLMDKDVTELPEEEPRVFVMPIMIGEGDMQPQIINLDELHKMKPDLFKSVIQMADQPNVGANKMQMLLGDVEDA